MTATTIDRIFDQRERAKNQMVRTDSGRPAGWRLPRLDTLAILNADLRWRALFADGLLCGPPRYRKPWATPQHLMKALSELAAEVDSIERVGHQRALRRVAQIAGYEDWSHVKAEAEAYEATTATAYRDGLVVMTNLVCRRPGFIRDDGLIFMLARDLVHEFSSTDPVDGSWGGITYPSRSVHGSEHEVATPQLFLQAVSASYYDPTPVLPGLYRYIGETPNSMEQAVKSCEQEFGWTRPCGFNCSPGEWDIRPPCDGPVSYIWLRGEMLVVSPYWD